MITVGVSWPWYFSHRANDRCTLAWMLDDCMPSIISFSMP